MSATLRFPLQRSGWMSAALLLALATVQPARTQDYNYPPQQQSYGQQNYGQPGDASQADPPSRVARVSMLQGNVSLQPSGVEDFSQASLNYPLTSGDRIYSDNGSLAELEAGQLAIRLGSATDLSVTSMTDQFEQFGLGQGSVHVHSYDLDPNATLEIDTPNVSVTVLAPGDLRVDVSADGNMTQVTLLSGQARVDGPGFQQQLQPGESLQLTGSEPVYAQDVRRPRGDNLDRFSSDRDRAYQDSIAMQSDYLNPATIGAADLGQYGDWSNDADNGPVWYPRSVAADWQPYSYGRWAYIAPWGWTWVENEPWGFAPFHYGRWARFGPRWGWIPGPRVVRPVYSPALVAFVGGGGASVTAWFPLGPREPYVPWYRTSPLYANRVNVSNIYSRNTVEVRNIYNQRTTNVYVNNTTFNRSYANRQLATVAIPQNAFAGGRPVHEVAMHLPPQQFANGPLLSRPNATPTRQIMAPTPARALPPRINRPPVETRGPGFQPGGPNRPDRGGFGNGGLNRGGSQPDGGNRVGSGNQPPNSGYQPGNRNGNLPGRGDTPGQQPGQPGVGQYSGRGGQDSGRGNNGPQNPGRGDSNGNNQGQRPTFTGQPGRVESPTRITPGNSNPPNGGNTSTPGQPGSGQYPQRGGQDFGRGGGSGQNPERGAGSGNGQGQPPILRGDPGRQAPPPAPQPTPNQTPNQGAPVFHGAPGRTISPTPIQPGGQQPLQTPPPNYGSRPHSGAHPVEMPPERGQQQQEQPRVQPQPAPGPQPRFQPQPQPQQPAQQPQPQPQQPAQQPQRFQPAPQQPRLQPQPTPAPQPQRQFTPQQPAPRQPAPAPAATPNEHPHGY